MLERTVPKTDWNHPYRIIYQQVEGDDDNELHVDDGDKDTDNILKHKVPCMIPGEFSMICLMIIFGFIWKTNEHGNWTY